MPPKFVEMGLDDIVQSVRSDGVASKWGRDDTNRKRKSVLDIVDCDELTDPLVTSPFSKRKRVEKVRHQMRLNQLVSEEQKLGSLFDTPFRHELRTAIRRKMNLFEKEVYDMKKQYRNKLNELVDKEMSFVDELVNKELKPLYDRFRDGNAVAVEGTQSEIVDR